MVESVVIENYIEFERLLKRLVGEEMTLLPLEVEPVVVELATTCFKIGYTIAIDGKCEVKL